jgi:hypothetical protein
MQTNFQFGYFPNALFSIYLYLVGSHAKRITLQTLLCIEFFFS